MRNNKDENIVFINACKKAGLKVHSKESSKIAEGLVIVDARGNNYSVTPEGVVCADRPIVGQMMSRPAYVPKRVGHRNAIKCRRAARRGRVWKIKED